MSLQSAEALHRLPIPILQDRATHVPVGSELLGQPPFYGHEYRKVRVRGEMRPEILLRDEVVVLQCPHSRSFFSHAAARRRRGREKRDIAKGTGEGPRGSWVLPRALKNAG